jgi:DNA-binding NarL/FixJ family response regulator
MVDLDAQDTLHLLQTIHRLYALNDSDSFGRDTLVLIEQLVSPKAAALISHPLGFPETSVKAQSLDPDLERLLYSELLPISLQHPTDSPFVQYAQTVAQGGAHKVSDFVTREDLMNRASSKKIFNLIPYDDNMVLLVQGETLLGDPIIYYYLYNCWGQWTERDRTLLNLFQPHLIQAYHRVMYCQRQQYQIEQLQDRLDRTGVIFLDPSGNAQSITAQAKAWLRHYFPGVQSPSCLPETLQGWVNHQLAQLQRTDPYPALLPLRIQQDDHQLSIRLTINQPEESYLLLLGEEAILSRLTALEVLGVSRREAEVLLGIVQGQDNPAIAQTLNISEGTVRKHVENIYRKLNVQSRAEAIARVLEKLGVFNPLLLD